MEISVEILATSVPITKDNLRYKVKTWWAHVDVEGGEGEGQSSLPKVIRLPSLPMIQPFYEMNGRQTTVFVEMWYNNPQLFPEGTMRFLGLAKQRVDNQLRNPSWNPTVEWLEVYDPIEDISRGRLLLKIDAHFLMSTENDAVTSTPQSLVNRGNDPPPPHLVSSYFTNPVPESGVTSQNQGPQKVNNGKEAQSSKAVPPFSFNTSLSPIPKVYVKSVPVQTEDEREMAVFKRFGQGQMSARETFDFPQPLNNPALDSNSERDDEVKLKEMNEKKDKIDLDLEIAKAKLELAVRERERNRQLLEKKGQHFNRQAGERPYNSLPDFWNLDMSPITSTTTPPRRCRQKKLISKISNRNRPSEFSESPEPSSTDSDVDDVIKILNNKVANKPVDQPHINTDKTPLDKPLQRPPPEMDARTENLCKNIKQLELLQTEIKNARPPNAPKPRLPSQERSEGYRPSGTRRLYSEEVRDAMAKVLDEEDLTIYGCGFHVKPTSKHPSNNNQGPRTSLNYASVQEQRNNANPKSSNLQKYDNCGMPSSRSCPPIPPISRKCAAKFETARK